MWTRAGTNYAAPPPPTDGPLLAPSPPSTPVSPIVATTSHELEPAGTAGAPIGLGLSFDGPPAMEPTQVSTAPLSLLPSPESDVQAGPTVVHQASHLRSDEEPEVASNGSLHLDSALSPRDSSDAEDRPTSGSEGEFYSPRETTPLVNSKFKFSRSFADMDDDDEDVVVEFPAHWNVSPQRAVSPPVIPDTRTPSPSLEHEVLNGLSPVARNILLGLSPSTREHILRRQRIVDAAQSAALNITSDTSEYTIISTSELMSRVPQSTPALACAALHQESTCPHLNYLAGRRLRKVNSVRERTLLPMTLLVRRVVARFRHQFRSTTMWTC